MEDFNIAEALKYAPEGLKLYSPLVGEVALNQVGQDFYPIQVRTLDCPYTFTKYGHFNDKGECLLFPSKDHRTWDNWQNTLFPQSIGSVCVYTTGALKPTMFLCTSNGTVFSDNTGSTWESLIGQSGNYLNASRYAIEEETKQFFEKLKANGYEWDAEKKELRKLQSDKFDITTLKPFDKVLVRDIKGRKWCIEFYSYYDTDTNSVYKFVTTSGNIWKRCVPYNDDTKHLVGTTDDAPDFYKTWDL